MIITADLLKNIDSNKVIPIIRQSGTHYVPTFLKSKLYLDFSRPGDFEFSYDELVRTIHAAPLFVKPPIGNNPFTPVTDIPQERTGDAIKTLMKIVVADFEKGEPWTLYRGLHTRMSVSRVMLDLLIGQAVADDLIRRDRAGDLIISDGGKRYALQHELV